MHLSLFIPKVKSIIVHGNFFRFAWIRDPAFFGAGIRGFKKGPGRGDFLRILRLS